VLERILGMSLSLQAIETRVADAAEDVTAFYEPPVAPTTYPPGSTILVVQADGKDVPMVQPSPVAPPVRLGTGQKRTQKKEAVLTSLDTVAPYPRTPQEIGAALLAEGDRPATAARPVPVGKDCMRRWRGRRSRGCAWHDGQASAKGYISSSGWPSPMVPKPCRSGW
jgi:hypothetical protein